MRHRLIELLCSRPMPGNHRRIAGQRAPDAEKLAVFGHHEIIELAEAMASSHAIGSDAGIVL
jgi:hypothetical protein